MSTPPVISHHFEMTCAWGCALALARVIEMTQSNIRGHCCASMALLIKQTFHPHNSNVWTKRKEGGGWVRVPFADRLVAPDK